MIYGIFVIATLIVITYSIIRPVINDLYTTEPAPHITLDPGNKTLLYLLLLLCSAVLAPVMFLIWILPGGTKLFKQGLLADLKKS